MFNTSITNDAVPIGHDPAINFGKKFESPKIQKMGSRKGYY